jgi:hypothetical protein
LWVLASSRPDLIEVDLKRPGRIDVKIPIFPTTTPDEGFRLIRALAERRGLELPESDFEQVRDLIPNLLTPGAAESLAIKVYRVVKTKDVSPLEALKQILGNYQHPIAPEVMAAQIRLAVDEASDLAFVPAMLRGE